MLKRNSVHSNETVPSRSIHRNTHAITTHFIPRKKTNCFSLKKRKKNKKEKKRKTKKVKMNILRSVVVAVRSPIEGSRVLFCYNSENEPFTKFTLTANLEETGLEQRDIKYYHPAEKSIVDFGSLLVPRRMKEGDYIFSADRYTLVGYVKQFPEDEDEENSERD